MHPASISTRAAATQGGARAAAVVHGVVVDRRSVGCREGWLCPAFALPSIHPGESTYLKSRPSSSPRWLVGGLSSMAPRTRKSGKAVLAGGVGWWPELLGHGDGRWRRRPQGVKGRGEDEMKRGGRETASPWRSATGSRSGCRRQEGHALQHLGAVTQAAILLQHSKGKSALIFCSTRKGAQEAAQCLSKTAVSWLLNKFIHEIDAAV